MKISVFWIIALALGTFQLTFLNYFGFFGVKPELFLLCVLIASLFFELRLAFVFCLLLGIFKDIFSLHGSGLDIAAFGLWCLLINKLSRKVSIEDSLSATFLLFVIALLHNILSGLALAYSGKIVPFGIFLRIVLLGALYTALPLPLIFKISKAKI